MHGVDGRVGKRRGKANTSTQSEYTVYIICSRT